MKKDNYIAASHSGQVDVTKLYRELRVTRIVSMISSLLMVLLLVGGVFFYMKIKELQEQARPALEQISALDVEEFNRALVELNTSLENVDWEQVAQVVGQLDVDALNTAIENLDTRELTEALANLNAAADILEQLGNNLKSLLPFL